MELQYEGNVIYIYMYKTQCLMYPAGRVADFMSYGSKPTKNGKMVKRYRSQIARWEH